MKWLIALGLGMATAVSGTLLHATLAPIGISLALIAIAVGARVISHIYQSRSADILFALGWLLIVVRGSTLGNGGELLIENNGLGNTFVLVGLAILGAMIVTSQRRRSRT